MESTPPPPSFFFKRIGKQLCFFFQRLGKQIMFSDNLFFQKKNRRHPCPTPEYQFLVAAQALRKKKKKKKILFLPTPFFNM
jgi:CRISPR/Cas system CSM-associated protein Csm4 (group 5 of RAMP superfamily)